MMLTTFLFFAGLVCLIVGAEVLVRGASSLAARLGMSALVIGLTVVAFGTSAPEMSVSILSSLNGQPGIALGNAVGSNICNVLFILGLAALVAPLVVARQIVRIDVPIMIAVSILALLFSLDGRLSRWEGALFLAGIGAYIGFLLVLTRRSGMAAGEEPPSDAPSTPSGHWAISLALVLLGLLLLVLGSRWLVDSAVTMARLFGVGDLIIGLTIVAGGTSLPEAATSVIATLRGERDIAVGNIVGSNIFNILVVLGASSVLAPGGIPVPETALALDLPVMVVVAVACLPVFFTGHRINRWEGLLFLGYYVAYLVYVILTSSRSEHLDLFTNAMLLFVGPLTAVTLTVVTWRALRRQNA